jgi:IMP dehydrogenase
MKKGLTFSDVLITPKYSEIESRREVSLKSNFGPFSLDLPIFAANMASICGPRMAYAMASHGAIGIMHRFCTIDQAINDIHSFWKYQDEDSRVNKSNMYKFGVSIGIQDNDMERLDKIYEAGARIICIDVAMGHCKRMKDMIKNIKSKNYNGLYLIAGNIATYDAAKDLIDWGADCIKIGIGPGSACMTRRNTGVGVSQLSAIEWARNAVEESKKNVKIIADGGITSAGCISKLLKYADGAMLGGMLGGTSETPGQVFKDENGEYYKVFMGSASGENKTSNGQTNEYIEGIAKKVKIRGHVKYILREIEQGVQSAFSYTNSRNIEEFRKNCEFIELSNGSKSESKI